MTKIDMNDTKIFSSLNLKIIQTFYNLKMNRGPYGLFYGKKLTRLNIDDIGSNLSEPRIYLRLYKYFVWVPCANRFVYYYGDGRFNTYNTRQMCALVKQIKSGFVQSPNDLIVEGLKAYSFIDPECCCFININRKLEIYRNEKRYLNQDSAFVRMRSIPSEEFLEECKTLLYCEWIRRRQTNCCIWGTIYKLPRSCPNKEIIDRLNVDSPDSKWHTFEYINKELEGIPWYANDDPTADQYVYKFETPPSEIMKNYEDCQEMNEKYKDDDKEKQT